MSNNSPIFLLVPLNCYDHYLSKKNGTTNWKSKFGGPCWEYGGPCWEYVDKFDEYYLHLFDVSMADLNWSNPDVRKEVQDIVQFWIDKGIKGFRFDVIN